MTSLKKHQLVVEESLVSTSQNLQCVDVKMAAAKKFKTLSKLLEKSPLVKKVRRSQRPALVHAHVTYYRRSSVICLSVSLSGTIVSHTKMAEPIEVPFRLWTLVGPRSRVLDGGPDLLRAMAIFRGKDGQL